MHLSIDWHLAIVGVILVVLALPMWLQWVPPNPYYGLRVKATDLDDRVWYSANAVCGRDFVILGGVLVLLSMLLPGTWHLSNEAEAALDGKILAPCVLVLSLIAWWRANRMLKRRQHLDDIEDQIEQMERRTPPLDG